MKVVMSRKVLTVKELADYLAVHASTVYRLLKKESLPAFKVGSDWRFNLEDIERWRLRLEGEEQSFRPALKGGAVADEVIKVN